MKVWLVRAGKHGEDEAAELKKGLAIIGWHAVPDVSKVESYDAMKGLLAEAYPDLAPSAIENTAAQLWAFRGRIDPGDIVALPIKTQSKVALGKGREPISSWMAGTSVP